MRLPRHLVLFVAGTAVAFSATVAYACSCAPLESWRERYEYSDVVFVGTVIGGGNSLHKNYTFRVIEPLKGSATGTLVSVNPGALGCLGTSFTRHRTYLVFAGFKPNGELGTSNCASNRLLPGGGEDPETAYYRSLHATDCTPIIAPSGTQYPQCTKGKVPLEYVADPADVERMQVRDLPRSHPSFEALTYLRARGVVTGYANGTLRPDGVVTRAEFVKIVAWERVDRARIQTCLATVTYDTGPYGYKGFEDVPKGTWFAPYVCVFRGLSFALETSGEKFFKPSEPVTMRQAAFVLHDLYDLNLPSLSLTEVQQQVLPVVKQLQTEGLLPSSYRSPDQTLTRGELAEMLWRLRQKGYYTSQ